MSFWHKAVRYLFGLILSVGGFILLINGIVVILAQSGPTQYHTFFEIHLPQFDISDFTDIDAVFLNHLLFAVLCIVAGLAFSIIGVKLLFEIILLTPRNLYMRRKKRHPTRYFDRINQYFDSVSQDSLLPPAKKAFSAVDLTGKSISNISSPAAAPSASKHDQVKVSPPTSPPLKPRTSSTLKLKLSAQINKIKNAYQDYKVKKQLQKTIFAPTAILQQSPPQKAVTPPQLVATKKPKISPAPVKPASVKPAPAQSTPAKPDSQPVKTVKPSKSLPPKKSPSPLPPKPVPQAPPQTKIMTQKDKLTAVYRKIFPKHNTSDPKWLNKYLDY